MTESLPARLARHLRPGCLVAIGDGAGAPVGLGDALAEAAASVGGVRLLLGWCLVPPVPWDRSAFTDIRTIMGGYALRAPVRDGRVRYLPTRLASFPALLAGPLRPDVVITSLAANQTGPAFGTEVAWLPAAIETGAAVMVEVNHGLPAAAGGQRPSRPVHVVDEVDRAPIEVASPAPDAVMMAIGAAVAALVPEGAALQVGPGQLGQAVVAAIDRPIAVASGLLSDGVVDLEERGLLVGTARATYLVGTQRLYRWADGRSVLARLEETHDPARLPAGRPFVAVNAALQIDRTGQVNVEAVGGDPMGGIGGHADFALAATRSPQGLSIVGLPTRHGGRSTLVDRLDTPVSTPRCDVEIVVTEHGAADLRGLSDQERSEALATLWGMSPAPVGVGGGSPQPMGRFRR